MSRYFVHPWVPWVTVIAVYKGHRYRKKQHTYSFTDGHCAAPAVITSVYSPLKAKQKLIWKYLKIRVFEIRNVIALIEDSNDTPVRPSDKSSVKMKISVQHCLHRSIRRKILSQLFSTIKFYLHLYNNMQLVSYKGQCH